MTSTLSMIRKNFEREVKLAYANEIFFLALFGPLLSIIRVVDAQNS